MISRGRWQQRIFLHTYSRDEHEPARPESDRTICPLSQPSRVNVQSSPVLTYAESVFFTDVAGAKVG